MLLLVRGPAILHIVSSLLYFGPEDGDLPAAAVPGAPAVARPRSRDGGQC